MTTAKHSYIGKVCEKAAPCETCGGRMTDAALHWQTWQIGYYHWKARAEKAEAELARWEKDWKIYEDKTRQGLS